jgi:2-methylcitrate dehydratase PrpD
MGATVELAEFVAETDFDRLPPDLIGRAKVYILDNLAAGFIGSVQPWSLLVAGLVRELGGAEVCSVFNQPWRTDPSRATLVNGVMMGAFEAEHVGHVAHPSATVFPAALAAAERYHADGRSFLTAMLLGYEVVCRVGEAQTAATERERGFHNPGVNGAFGAAAAVGRLLGLDAGRLAWALGIAGSHACGLAEFAWEGAMTKRMHPGRAAQLGLESALLAARGFTGPTTVLEGRYGYLNAYSPSPRPERLTAGLGREWLAADLIIKAYPCHMLSQGLVHAIVEFKARTPLDPREVRRVVVAGPFHAGLERHLDPQPRTVLGAQYSIPFTVATALCRDLSDPLVFNEGLLADPLVGEVARRVEIRPDPDSAHGWTPHQGHRVVIETGAGRHELTAAGFPGGPGRPLDFAGAAEKLYRYAGPVIGRAACEELVGLVARLEEVPDVARLARAVGRSPENAPKEDSPR